jgi:hypothetical protein
VDDLPAASYARIPDITAIAAEIRKEEAERAARG